MRFYIRREGEGNLSQRSSQIHRLHRLTIMRSTVGEEYTSTMSVVLPRRIPSPSMPDN